MLFLGGRYAMMILLSPAKTLDFESALPFDDLPLSSPQLIADSRLLIARLRKLNESQLGKLMSLSENLSRLNLNRYQEWSGEGERAALYAFKGDVYQGLEAESMDRDLIEFAERHVKILSGLYGAITPLTAIEAHRLEMGTKLTTRRGKQLYDFWGDKVTELLNEAISTSATELVINLASNEYSKVIKHTQLNARVITPIFKDEKSGQYKIISFFAKRARGLLTRHLLEHSKILGEEAMKETQNIKRGLESFTAEGYVYDPSASTPETPLFLRSEAARHLSN